MKVPFKLGEVGHFGLAVRDPKKSAQWFQRALEPLRAFLRIAYSQTKVTNFSEREWNFHKALNP